MVEEEEEEEEEGRGGGEEQIMMTPDLEPLLQPIKEENKQGIPMEKEVLIQTSERAKSEGHVHELPVHAPKKKEAMNDIAEHCEEQENVDERRDHIGCSTVPERNKRKEMSDTVVEDLVRENPSAVHLEKPERVTVIPGVYSIPTSTMSTMKNSIRSSHITKRRRSHRKTIGTRGSTEATNVPLPPTNTLSPTTSTDLNEVWQITLYTIKFYKNNIIQYCIREIVFFFVE